MTGAERARRAAAAVLAACVAGVWSAGCLASQEPPVRTRFVLDVAPERIQDPGTAGSVRVGRIRVAPLFERKGLVYRTGDDRYASDFYNEFYAPPGEMLRQAVSDWLARSGTFSRVLEPGDSEQADWWLEGRVDQLYGDLRRADGPEAVVEAGFTLLDARGAELAAVLERRYRAVVALDDGEPRSVVEGLSRGLAQILERLDADLARAVAGRAPSAEAGQPAGAEAGRAEEEDVRR